MSNGVELHEYKIWKYQGRQRILDVCGYDKYAYSLSQIDELLALVTPGDEIDTGYR